MKKVLSFNEFTNEHSNNKVDESNLNESKNSLALTKEILKAINKIDDSMGYEDLALAIGQILEDEYGEHNYLPFIKVLVNTLKVKGVNINESNSISENNLEDKLVEFLGDISNKEYGETKINKYDVIEFLKFAKKADYDHLEEFFWDWTSKLTKKSEIDMEEFEEFFYSVISESKKVLENVNDFEVGEVVKVDQNLIHKIIKGALIAKRDIIGKPDWKEDFKIVKVEKAGSFGVQYVANLKQDSTNSYVTISTDALEKVD